MDRQAKKLFKILGSLLVIVFFLIGFAVNSQIDRQNLEVCFLDVGQGDAILIKTPYEQNILIDGGPDNSILSQLGNNLAFFDKELDLVILTHPHSDHVAGLVEVLRRYSVNKILMTGVSHTSPDYLTFLEEVSLQKIETEITDSQKDIVLGDDLVLRILYPWTDLSGQEVASLNNSSIITKLIYKDTSFLLTGDAEEQVEHDLVNNQIEIKADVLKLGHHGSKYSTTQEFLDQVQPQYGVIQVGQDNKFGHPHLRILKRLEDNNIQFFRNDLDGPIIFISDGQNLSLKKRGE
ncbi:MAG: MBL fold metallo-hydrolase [Candidatus Buchananbacteria bacterium]|nr:MBL fold metallo-hydrolase [Candidatus Buchananbacteria bacterium]